MKPLLQVLMLSTPYELTIETSLISLNAKVYTKVTSN